MKQNLEFIKTNVENLIFLNTRENNRYRTWRS